MPSDVVMFVLTTGIGVSVIAGVLSGVCYVLVYSVNSSRRKSDVTLDPVCRPDLVKCEKNICVKCMNRRSWFQEIFASIYTRFKEMKIFCSHEIKMEQIQQKKEENESIRSTIEMKIAEILGESVDDASIFRVCNDDEYKWFFEKYHRDLSNAIINFSLALQVTLPDTSTTVSQNVAFTYLKYLLEKILKSGENLPRFEKNIEHTSHFEQVEHTYEELLSTAILNKVVNKTRHFPPSPSTKKKKEDEDNWGENEDTSSSSEDLYTNIIQTNPTVVSSKFVDPFSLTLRQRSEQINPMYLDQSPIDEEVTFSSLESSNWLLQRPSNYSSSPSSVSMLVPNPTTTAKVYIGEKDVEDTSDLSDVESSSEQHLPDEDSSLDSGLRDEVDADIFKRKLDDVKLSETEDETDSYYSDSVLTSNTKKRRSYVRRKESLKKKQQAPVGYGRDYYTRQASMPSGQSKMDIEENGDEVGIFKAVPVIVNDTDYERDSWIASTSDSDVSMVHFYDVEKAQHSIQPQETNKGETNVRKKHVEKEPGEWSEPKLIHYEKIEYNNNVNKTEEKEQRKNVRADNTLIKKIYSNPVVRSFALSNREQIPGEAPELAPQPVLPKPTPRARPVSVSHFPDTPLKPPNVEPPPIPEDYESQLPKIEETAVNFSLEFSETEEVDAKSTEFEELRDMHLVANRLSQFSKSFPNLMVVERQQQVRNSMVFDEDFELGPSVKNLRELFERKSAASSGKDVPVHSLTARSISMKMKEDLKNRNYP